MRSKINLHPVNGKHLKQNSYWKIALYVSILNGAIPQLISTHPPATHAFC